MVRVLLLVSIVSLCFYPAAPSFSFESKGQDCSKCHTLSSTEANSLLRNMIPDVNTLSVTPSPVKGLWEVFLESRGKKGIVYVDFSKKYFMTGTLISLAERKNVTQERYTELNRVDVSQIPLTDALVVGDPAAKTKVIVFSDPD